MKPNHVDVQSSHDSADKQGSGCPPTPQEKGGEEEDSANLDTTATLEPAVKCTIVKTAISGTMIRLPATVELRGLLSPVDRVALCLRAADSGAAEAPALLHETAQFVSELPIGSVARKTFWNRAHRFVEYEGLLWDLAPDGIRGLVQVPRRVARPPKAAEAAPTVAPLKMWEGVDWATRLASEPVGQLVAEAVALVRQIRPSNRGRCVVGLPQTMLRHETAGALRKLLLGDDGVKVYLELLSHKDLSQSILNEFALYCKQLSREKEADLWVQALEHSPNQRVIRGQLPHQVRVELTRRKHAGFMTALAQIEPPPTESVEACDAWRLYAGIDEQDSQLAGLWAGKEPTDYASAMMLSARGAEKAAARFYQALGFLVEDVAIQQLDPTPSGDWRTHDLVVGNSKLVDVKNARTAVNSRGGYSEHIVPRFKHDRHGLNVTVLGVRSPFLTLHEITGHDSLPLQRAKSILVLGECTRQELADLRADFVSDLLHDISFRRADRVQKEGREFLPPWVFSYPAAFYEQEPMRRQSTQAAELKNHAPPSRADAELLNLNPLPFLLQGLMPVPVAWRESMEKWENELIPLLKLAADRSSLPRLFLSLLRDFLTAAKENRGSYSPSMYRVLLFPGTGDPRSIGWGHFPIGIYDPLESIESLITTLELLWRHRTRVGLSDFVTFRFSAAGMLRGQRRGHEEDVTLLAYCGGRTEANAPCGNNPLILGTHQSCTECGFLVCEKCHHCSLNCSQRVARQGRD